MADVKISALPLATTPLAGTEVLPIVQSATTDQVSVANLTAGRSVSAASLTLTTTPLAVGSGGTGLTSLTAGYIPYGNGMSAFSSGGGLTYDGTMLTANSVVKISGSTNPYLVLNDGTYNAYLQISSGVFNAYTASIPMTFSPGGSERMRIASDGTVGIGTSSPTGKLTVSGGRSHFIANSEIYAVSVGYASAGAYYLGANSANNALLISNSGGAEVARFDSAGNLGLGVTPTGYFTLQGASNYSSGFKGFNLGGYQGGASGGGYPWVGYNIRLTSTGDVYNYNGNDVASAIKFAGGINFYVAPSGTAGNAISFTQAMTLDASGNLLVGDTATVGSSRFYAKNTAGTAGRFYNSAASQQSIAALVVDKADNTNTTSQVFVQFTINSQATGSGQINANGANAAAFGSYSDARLKENITPLASQLSNILALKPSEFDYLSGGHQIGFIAQEMQEVYPDVVGEGDDGMLMITGWGKTEARLVKAIQELAAKVTALEAKQ